LVGVVYVHMILSDPIPIQVCLTAIVRNNHCIFKVLSVLERLSSVTVLSLRRLGRWREIWVFKFRLTSTLKRYETYWVYRNNCQSPQWPPIVPVEKTLTIKSANTLNSQISD